MSVTIYHNPRCSKSRQTLALLKEHGVTPTIIEYLEQGPDAQTLTQILSMLQMEPRDLMRKGEAEYKDNGLNDDSLSRDALIQAMVDHPRLIERPIVLKGNRAAIGRPPESVLDIL